MDEAVQAIKEADLIVLGPGFTLYKRHIKFMCQRHPESTIWIPTHQSYMCKCNDATR